MLDKQFVPICTVVLLTLPTQPVWAGEETLSFRLVTRAIDVSTHTDDNIEGLGLSAGQSVGVAVFDDGRLAYKEYVYLGYEGENAPAKQPGFSSYTFENGDSFQVSFMYGAGDAGYSVEYEVISGTGAYAGATGTGQIILGETKWDQALFWEGSINLVTP